MTEPTIALVFSPEPWVEQLHRHLADHGGARVRQIVLDPALALEESYDVLVVSHRWPGLTARFVQAVQARGSAVLGVFDPDEPAGEAYLRGLGVDQVIAADVAIAHLVGAIAALPRLAFVVSGARGGARAADPPPAARVPRHAPLVVTGIPGSGASEIALGVAVASARRRMTVLVDAHEHSPSLATRLGLPLEPGLPAAVEAVEHELGDLSTALLPVARHLHAVVGAPGTATAAQLRVADVAAVLFELGDLGAAVIVDVATDRDATIGRPLLHDAGALVFVAPATPLGVTRTLAWFAQPSIELGTIPVHVVLNRAPRERFRRAELARELSRTLGRGDVTFVPSDMRVDDAMWRGTVVGIGPFSGAVGGLVDSLHRAGPWHAPNLGVPTDASPALDASDATRSGRPRPAWPRRGSRRAA